MAWDAKLYTYRVRWSEEDEEYLATVAEFPSLSWLDESMPDALSGLVALVSGVIADLESEGAAVPEPLSVRSYSGNVRLRLPPEQHRELAIRASEEGVSLNRLICSLISRPSGAVAAASNHEPHIVTERGSDESRTFSKTATYSAVHAAREGRGFSLVQGDTVASSASGVESLSEYSATEWLEEMWMSEGSLLAGQQLEAVL